MVILHAYQPPYPIQEKWVLDRIVKNCYRPIMEHLSKYPKVKFILNINASLSEMLERDASDVLRMIFEAVARGQIELLNSGAYHPIMPIINDREKDIQFEKNIEINKRLIGQFNPTGFFPPELAVDNDLMQYLAHKKINYVIIPENSIPVDHEKSIAFMELDGHRLHLIPRDKQLSNHISFAKDNRNLDKLITIINDLSYRKKPIVIAMDIETFGEHHENYWEFLFQFLNHEEIEPILSDEYLNYPEKHKVKAITASSWSTDNHQLSDIPFPLWDHPLNPIHVIQQTHFELVRQSFEGIEFDELSFEKQMNILAAYHSCQFWWASGTPGNGRWSKEMIRKGMMIQQIALKDLTDDPIILNLSNALSKKLEIALNMKT